MKKATWPVIAAIAVIIIAAIIIVRSSLKTNDQTSSTGASAQAVRLNSKAGLDDYLVDAKGMTLYYFSNDVIGRSNCLGGCLTVWPPFYADELEVQAPLKKDDFGSAENQSGVKFATYKGWPLYYYQPDQNPGDTLGEGVNNIWYVMTEPFYNVMILNNLAKGVYLADNRGLALYYFDNDIPATAGAPAQSNCTGQCLALWPIFASEQIVAPSFINNGDFSIITRPDGATQAVYKGRPLYYYANDNNSGETNGDGFNNVWHLVKP
ncbi:MAG: hypothetical protein Q8O93_04920 [bacterium]|nr:hypothetical protein [bacterium]